MNQTKRPKKCKYECCPSHTHTPHTNPKNDNNNNNYHVQKRQNSQENPQQESDMRQTFQKSNFEKIQRDFLKVLTSKMHQKRTVTSSKVT